MDSKLESGMRFGPAVPACVPRASTASGPAAEETDDSKRIKQAATKIILSAEPDVVEVRPFSLVGTGAGVNVLTKQMLWDKEETESRKD